MAHRNVLGSVQPNGFFSFHSAKVWSQSYHSAYINGTSMALFSRGWYSGIDVKTWARISCQCRFDSTRVSVASCWSFSIWSDLTPVTGSILDSNSWAFFCHQHWIVCNNGHISRFSLSFEDRQVISSFKFSSVEEVDLSSVTKLTGVPLLSGKRPWWGRKYMNPSLILETRVVSVVYL